MTTERFLLPDLGEGLTEATIVTWLVQPGDTVAIDQPVVEVESAKSSVELPSPFAGQVEELCAAVGDVVRKDAPLIAVAVGAVAPAASADIVPGTALRADAGGRERSASGPVLVGYGVTESTRRLGRPAGGRFGRGRRHSGETTRHSPVVSPIVRKRARDNGFDASQLAGTGPGSLVLREDVDAAIAARDRARRSEEEAAGQASDLRIPITGMRKLIADHLTLSRRTIPEATIWLDVDATELVRAKERLLASTGERYSLTALIARFVVSGLQKYPALNSSVDDTAGEIVQHAAVNLGLAAQTSRGLMVPVVHDAQAMSLRVLRDAIGDLVTHAERGDYPPAALAGGTFTLNNYGAFGVDGSTPIINHPEAAMLGLGRVIDRPWVVAGELAVRKVATLSLVFDHRVCDGDVASGFLTYVARCMQEPLVALL
ncbi:dihydrolipoamide acetyltransferase family protein [Humibacter sp. RRB41]|uniref:dihydrolipoamide acetyltransferase family protein n=1 Tax=Humibacter sp. RRB41 TaxID=2919946 RepID=UPI001FAB3548|nr:dihydrolipoamide acetyltransferase family protein [Humibacter sp. RRB41]